MNIFVGFSFDGSWLLWLIAGGIAGLIAGNLYRGRGYGCLTNVILGIAGAIVGGWLFNQFGIGGPFFRGIGSIIPAIIGAFLIIFVGGLLGGDPKGRKRY